MPSTSVLDEARELVRRRLADLEEERKRLERALSAFNGAAPRRSPVRPRGGKSASTAAISAPRKRRKRRGGGRAGQAVKLIEKSPGIGASEIAKALKINPNYVYRVLGELVKEGRVKKVGRKYFAAE